MEQLIITCYNCGQHDSTRKNIKYYEAYDVDVVKSNRNLNITAFRAMGITHFMHRHCP